MNGNCPNGQTSISNIECESLLINEQEELIASELIKDRVIKWEETNKMYTNEKAIADAYGKGSSLNQLNHPRNIYDEKDESIYISDSDNCRIVK
jgi:hypothetical protein